MADKKKLNKRQTQDWLNLLAPNEVSVTPDAEQDNADSQRRRSIDFGSDTEAGRALNSQLALTSPTQGVAQPTQPDAPAKPLNTIAFNTANATPAPGTFSPDKRMRDLRFDFTTQEPDNETQRQAMFNGTPMNIPARVPNISGTFQADPQQLASQMMRYNQQPTTSNGSQAQVTTSGTGANQSPQDVVAQRQLSPEEKLLAALNDTNPTPRKFWQRLLAGAARGASTVTPQDEWGGAFGKIVGSTVANSIPQVDSAQQYQQKKANAIERYKIEATARDANERQTEFNSRIKESEARLAETKANNEERRAQAKLLNDARLRDDKRAEATQLMNAMKELPENDAQRLTIAKRLRDEYNVPISSKYGVKDKTTKQGADITIFDEASGNYIRANADGTPKLTPDGKPVVMKPAKDTESKANEREQDKAEADLVARQSTDARRGEIISKLPKKYQDALNNPAGSKPDLYAEAQKAFDTAYNAMLKQNQDYTRGQQQRTKVTNKQGVSTSRIKPTEENSRANKDARTFTLR